MTDFGIFYKKLNQEGAFESYAQAYTHLNTQENKVEESSKHILNKAISIAEICQELLLNKKKISDYSLSQSKNLIPEIAAFFSKHNMHALGNHYLDLLIQKHPKEPFFYLHLAKSFLAQGEPKNAAIAIKQAINLSEDSYENWLLAARISKKLGEFQEAIKCLENAFELDPSNRNGKRLLAEIFFELNFDQQSHFYVEDLLKTDPYDPDTLYLKGRMKLNKGDLSGWNDYEYRLSQKQEITPIYPQLNQDQKWKGEPLSGKTILIVNDQDFVSSFLFSSMLQGIIQESKYTKIALLPQLDNFFARKYTETAFSFPEQIEFEQHIYTIFHSTFVSEFDYWTPLGSIPQYRLENYALNPSVISPLENRVQFWQQQLKPLNNQLKIGINPQLCEFLGHDWESWDCLLSHKELSFFALSETLPNHIKEKYDILPRPYGSNESLETKAAFLTQLSLIIAPFSVESNMGALLGVPVMQITSNTHWQHLGTEKNPFFPEMQVLSFSLREPFAIQNKKFAEKALHYVQNRIQERD